MGYGCVILKKFSNAIWDFFYVKFNEPMSNRPKIMSRRFKNILCEDRVAITESFTETEIKEAVWCCGSEKVPRLDGFTFTFLKNYWELIKLVVFMFVKDFKSSGVLAKGYISSFISLIPKVRVPLYLKDYISINLVGCLYKVLSKVLVNRLKKVLDKIICHEQTAYVGRRRIQDCPILLNEIVAWTKKVKKKAFVFKSILIRRLTRYVGSSWTRLWTK